MITISKDIAVAIFAYNRPSHLRRVLISLENYKISNTYIFLDGPKNKNDKILQKEIIFQIKYNPYIKLKLKISKKNKGLAQSILKGVNYLTKKYKHVIVLEDDCIPREEFFIFINKLLKNNSYKKNLNPICGYQLPELEYISKKIKALYFDCFIPWGWCVSSDLWLNYLFYLKNKKISFSNNLLKKITRICKHKENKNIWSKKFIEFNLMLKKKIIFPSRSLVKNIGFDGSGVNSSVTDKFNTSYFKLQMSQSQFNIQNNKKIQKKQKQILLKRVKYFF